MVTLPMLFALPSLLLTLILPIQAAPPLDNNGPEPYHGLERRNNKYKLKCGNAPTVTAGDFLSPSLLPTPQSNHQLRAALPLSGSSENFMDYLYCTPNTATYTFFGVGTVSPQPSQWYDISGALTQAITNVSTYLRYNADGPFADGGNWTMTPPSTNMELHVQDAGGGRMTYGVLVSALTGLGQVVGAYVAGEKKTMVFQINDGEWGELGIGYLGFTYSSAGSGVGCVYDIVEGNGLPCEDVRQGSVIK